MPEKKEKKDRQPGPARVSNEILAALQREKARRKECGEPFLSNADLLGEAWRWYERQRHRRLSVEVSDSKQNLYAVSAKSVVEFPPSAKMRELLEAVLARGDQDAERAVAAVLCFAARGENARAEDPNPDIQGALDELYRAESIADRPEDPPSGSRKEVGTKRAKHSE